MLFELFLLFVYKNFFLDWVQDTEEDAKNFFQRIDTDRNERIDFSEFLYYIELFRLENSKKPKH